MPLFRGAKTTEQLFFSFYFELTPDKAQAHVTLFVSVGRFGLKSGIHLCTFTSYSVTQDKMIAG